MKSTLEGAANSRKLTGKLYVKFGSNGGHHRLGNTTMHKRDAKIDKTAFKIADKGFTRTVSEEVANLEDRWQVKSNQFPDIALRSLLFASRGVDSDQAATNGATATLSEVAGGQSYYIGARQVVNLVVSKSGNALTLGTDYEVDLGSGMLTVIPGGAADDNIALDLTFDMPALSYAVYSSPNVGAMVRDCEVRFEEFDQASRAPRATYIFPAQLSVSDRGENDGNKHQEATYDLLVTGDVTVEERLDDANA